MSTKTTNDAPRVSVIIPCHNDEQYLEQCLHSALRQTLRAIEVIVIDDASTDSSLRIAQSFAATDHRLKLIAFDQNRSASKARKEGVLAASGDYIMFLDADDYLEPDACERLYKVISRKKVDIVHFESRIIPSNDMPPERLSGLTKRLAPYHHSLIGDQVFTACFLNKLYRPTIWNKIYNAQLCRQAFALISDARLPKAQDFYAFFVIAWLANSYCGIAGKPYYNYRSGTGVTGHSRIDLATLETFCQGAWAADAVAAFAQDQGSDIATQAADQLRVLLIGECLTQWFRYLPDEIAAQGFDVLVKYWDASKLLAAIHARHKKHPQLIAQKVAGAVCLSPGDPKPVHTIGFCYSPSFISDARQTISPLVSIFTGMGYQVVLLTTDPSDSIEYLVPDEVRTVSIPAAPSDGRNYDVRAECLATATSQCSIDIMLYYTDHSPTQVFDILAIKLAGARLVAYSPESVLDGFEHQSQAQIYQPSILKLADRVLVPEKVDQMFFQTLGVNAALANLDGRDTPNQSEFWQQVIKDDLPIEQDQNLDADQSGSSQTRVY